MGRLECHRPFFALLPPADVVPAIAAVRDTIGPARSRMRDDRFHMTLLMIDDLAELPETLVEALRKVGDGVVADAPEIGLDRLSFGPGSAALAPGGPQPALRALQAALARGLARAGIREREGGYRFGPHVTLGFRPAAQGDRAIPPIRWTATDFVLLHSWVGLGRYDELGRWPLREQPRLL